MALYAIGDLHLSLGADKPMDVFGGPWENYVEKIRIGFSALHDDDVCVLCGDLAWGMTMEQALPDFQFIEALPGKKILLKGNHDFWWSTAKKAYDFFEAHDMHTMDILNNNCYFYGDYAICGTPMELEEFNAFTKAVRDIPRSEVPKLKALLEQFEVRDIETALFLTEHLADYILTPDLSSPQETAIDRLRFMTDDHAAKLLLSHVNLYTYGCDIIKEDNAAITPYGLLHRADYQPMLTPVQEKMEMTM